MLCEPLLERLAVEAPHVDLEVSGATNPLDLIDAGELDLAAGVFPHVRSGHSRTKLYEDEFVCMVRRGHPILKTKLTMRRYLELRHVVVAPAGARGSIVDSLLAGLDVTRRVAARIPSFLVAPVLVAGSDFINTGPALLAKRLAAIHPIVLLPPPMAIPPFTVSLVWHKRFAEDPAHRWFRELVMAVARAS